MEIRFVSNKTASPGKASRVAPVYEGNRIGRVIAENDSAETQLRYISQIQTAFTGKSEQFLVATPDYQETPKLVFLGMGDGKALDEAGVQKIGAKLYGELTAKGIRDAHIMADRTADTKLEQAAIAANLADALMRQSYSFDKYKTLPPKEPKKELGTVTIAVDDPVAAEAAYAPLRAVTEGSFWAADLANEPPNELYPETYAKRIGDELAPLGVTVRVIEPQEIQDRKMGGVWNVGKGSEHLPRVVVMEYDGTEGRQQEPVVLVGKGITFDTGGISLKPGADMDEMKYDMGGSAAMVGTMRALAARGAKVRMVAIVCLAENSPSHTAYRPGDIIKTMAGITVHIGNTDAEGRLVLADGLHLGQHLEYLEADDYIGKKPVEITSAKPRLLVDAATLTGAQVVALGNERAAVYTADDSLAAKFRAAGEATGEKCWPMPTGGDYDDAMRHKKGHADLNNIAGRDGGSCTARGFLHYFIERNEDGSDKYPWVHIDMAGPGIAHPGWGVRLLDRVIRDHYEEQPAAPQKPAAPPPGLSPLA